MKPAVEEERTALEPIFGEPTRMMGFHLAYEQNQFYLKMQQLKSRMGKQDRLVKKDIGASLQLYNNKVTTATGPRVQSRRHQDACGVVCVDLRPEEQSSPRVNDEVDVVLSQFSLLVSGHSDEVATVLAVGRTHSNADA